MLNQPMNSQPQTVMLGNQIVKVQSLNQLQQKVNNQPNVSSANTNQEGQRPIILGSTIKVLKVRIGDGQFKCNADLLFLI